MRVRLLNVDADVDNGEDRLLIFPDGDCTVAAWTFTRLSECNSSSRIEFLAITIEFWVDSIVFISECLSVLCQ